MNNINAAQNLGNPIRYSRGKDKYDNNPEQITAATFDDFREEVLADRSLAKGLTYICAPMSHGPHDNMAKNPGNGHWRLATHAEPCAFLPLDFDGFRNPEAFEATLQHLRLHKGFAYTTASHQPTAPRARAILATSREISRAERIILGEIIENELQVALGEDAIKFDPSVYRSEQPCYTPVTTSETYHFDGQALNVDVLLASYSAKLVESFKGNLQKEPPSETPEEILRVKQMLSRIPAAKAQGCTHKQYRNVIWALASTGWKCAEQLAREWCGKSPADFEEADFVRDWNSFDPNKPDGIYYGTLHYIAEQFEPEDPTTDDDWPDPQPIQPPFPDTLPLDTSFLPVSFQAYVDDQSELMQVPPDMIAAPLMVAAAACLGNILAIAPKARDTSWLVVPVLWGGCVGRPGLMKTPAISTATKPLDRIEEAMASSFLAKRQQYILDKMKYEALLSAAKTAAKNGSSISFPPEPVEPQLERLLVNDSTVQKLADILCHSPRGVLVLRDEIVSLLESLRAEGQEGARGFYLEAWNGLHAHRVDRIGRGSLIIPRLSLWVFGGIQPGKLQSYVRQATSGGGDDDGLLQRFQMLVWPDVSKDWKQVDRPPNLTARSAVDAVFMYLRNLDPVAIGATQGNIANDPEYLHFTTEAQALFDRWWAALEHSLRNGDKHPALESHQSKYKSLIPALALVIHLADYGTGPVTLEALEKAIQWGNYLWTHAKRVYASATNSAQSSAAELAKRIKTGKLANGFSAREVHRHHWQNLSSLNDVLDALDWLVDAGWLHRLSHPAGKNGGRPTDTYIINPKVLTVLSPTPHPL